MADFTKQQQQAITTLDRNVSVSAGAGSGKTRVLVERFLEILAQKKATAQEILAITFTRKAAKEMAERVRKGILQRLNESAADEDRAFWQQQLQLAASAPITTIDSFCNQVLRENPVEAGMDPAFTIREDYELLTFQKQSVHSFVNREMKEDTEEIRGLLALYTAPKLETMLLGLQDKVPDLLAMGDLAAPYKESLSREEDMRLAVDQAFDALVHLQDGVTAKTKQNLAELAGCQDQLHQWLQEGNYGAVQEFVKGINGRPKGIGDAVKALKASVADLLLLQYDGAGAQTAAWWQNLLTRFRDYLFQAAQAQEMYSFGFISAKAVSLLAEYPEVLARYRERFRFLMVDEFQDTNEEQKELVYLLSGGNKDKLLGHNLFVVGDAKQSIYRFRGADVSVFKKVRDAIAATGGDNIVMDDNFRSAPEIIEACNTLFDDLLGHDDKADVTAQPLRAHRDSTEKPVLAVLQQQDKGHSDQAKLAQGIWVAAKIRELVESHEDLRYGDVAILLPAIHLAQIYGEALSNLGIKSQISDSKGFYNRQEILDILNLLTVLLHPDKSWALAGILRSPFVGFTDEAITKLIQQWPDVPLWQALQQALDEPCVAVSRKLTMLSQTAAYLSLPELFTAMEQAFAIEPTLLSQRGGREKLANYRKLRSMAVTEAMTKGSTAGDFLQKLQLLRDPTIRERSAAQEDDPDAVKLMTIHASKGLEFPAVVLPNLSKDARGDTLGVNLLEGVGFGVQVADTEGTLQETSVYKTIKEEQDRQELSEKQRQLYVAMTRAEKYLVLVTVEKVKKSGKSDSPKEKWGQSLERVFAPEGPHGNQVVRVDADVEQLLAESGTVLQAEKEAPQVDPAVYDRIAPVVLPKVLRLSASALLEYDTCPRSYFYHYPMQMPGIEPEITGSGVYRVSAITLGTYVHKVLELCQALPLEEALEEALEDPQLEAPEAEKHLLRQKGGALAASYLDSPLYKDVAAYPQLAERDFELPLFQKADATVIFQGSIDKLVFLPDNQLGIIDYKTGHPPVDGQEKSGYTRQLVIYAKAAETLYKGKTVAWAQLHFLQDNSVWELKDRAAEEQKLEALLDTLLTLEAEDQFPVRLEQCKWCPYGYFCDKGKRER